MVRGQEHHVVLLQGEVKRIATEELLTTYTVPCAAATAEEARIQAEALAVLTSESTMMRRAR
jgi:hypothetical protein